MFTWIQKLADWVVFDLFKLSTESHFSEDVNMLENDENTSILELYR